MYASPSNQPQIIGPFFVNAISVDEMFLDPTTGTVRVPTLSLEIDVQDSGNNRFAIGVGITAELLRTTVEQLKQQWAAD